MGKPELSFLSPSTFHLEFLKESHGARGWDKHKTENENLKDSQAKY